MIFFVFLGFSRVFCWNFSYGFLGGSRAFPKAFDVSLGYLMFFPLGFSGILEFFLSFLSDFA